MSAASSRKIQPMVGVYSEELQLPRLQQQQAWKMTLFALFSSRPSDEVLRRRCASPKKTSEEEEAFIRHWRATDVACRFNMTADGAAHGKENFHGQVCEASAEATTKAEVGERGGGDEEDGGASRGGGASSSTEGLRIVSSTVASLQATMGGAMQKMAATLKQSCERPWWPSAHSHSRGNLPRYNTT